MFKIKRIILHCSDSPFGNALLIEKWHRDRGWNGIGYHYVITNQHPFSSLSAEFSIDGMIETGRDPKLVGAHVRGHNKDSIGICFIGKAGQFTPKQLTTSRVLISNLSKKYHLAPESVLSHHELNPHKECPGLNMNLYRLFLQDFSKLGALLNG